MRRMEATPMGGDLVSFSALARELKVSVGTISRWVEAYALDSHRLPHSARGRALAPAEAGRIRDVARERADGAHASLPRLARQSAA